MVSKIFGILISSLLFVLFVSFFILRDNFLSVRDQNIFIYAISLYAIIVVFRIIYLAIWKSNYQFQFLPEYIFLHTGVIAKEEKHVPYRTLQDVTISQSIIDRFFGLANVMIENAAQNVIAGNNQNPVSFNNSIVIPGQTLERANKLTELLKNVILTKNSSVTGL